jgi:hypothetical protein
MHSICPGNAKPLPRVARGEHGEQRGRTDPLTERLGALAVRRAAPDADALVLEGIGEALETDEAAGADGLGAHRAATAAREELGLRMLPAERVSHPCRASSGEQLGDVEELRADAHEALELVDADAHDRGA